MVKINYNTEFQVFIYKNNLKKSLVAEYLGVSNAFVTQLTQGLRDVPEDKIAIIKANSEWDSSMFNSNITQSQSLGNNSTIIGGNVIGGYQSIKENTLDPKELYDMLDKKDKQIDKLISIIEKLQK